MESLHSANPNLCLGCEELSREEITPTAFVEEPLSRGRGLPPIRESRNLNNQHSEESAFLGFQDDSVTSRVA